MASKKAILVVSFGTSQKETRDKCIGSIEETIAKAFPDWEVRRAFTSRMIIKRILKETGMKIDYIDEALQKLADDGFGTVIVQPTHFVKGIEYEDVVKYSMQFRDRFENLAVSEPLLNDEESFDAMTAALRDEVIPAMREKVSPDCAVVLMGHGTEHFSNSCYSQMYMKLILNGIYDVYMVTVEGFPRFSDLEKLMVHTGKKKVAVMPFMIVAGVHAIEDMASDEPDSLKCTLQGLGYDVTPLMIGMGEFPSIRKLFTDACAACMEKNGLQ